MGLNKEAAGELLLIRARGVAAEALTLANIYPGEYWPMLRGETLLTLRALGEIGYLTGFDFSFEFRPIEDRGTSP